MKFDWKYDWNLLEDIEVDPGTAAIMAAGMRKDIQDIMSNGGKINKLRSKMKLLYSVNSTML